MLYWTRFIGPCFIGQLTRVFFLSMEQLQCHFFSRVGFIEELTSDPSETRSIWVWILFFIREDYWVPYRSLFIYYVFPRMKAIIKNYARNCILKIYIYISTRYFICFDMTKLNFEALKIIEKWKFSSLDNCIMNKILKN